MSVLKQLADLQSEAEVHGFEATDLGALDLPRIRPGSPTLPKAGDMAAWRRIADLQLENVLAGFDDRLVKGTLASAAAAWAVTEFQSWVQASLRAIPTERAMTMLGARRTHEERQYWSALGRDCVANAEVDPDGVDRFLRLYLAMAHELAARGFASLLAPSSSAL